MSRKEIPNELQNRLEEFQVEVPEFPAKKNKSERIANWIYAPAKNPLEVLSINGNSITRLVVYPLIFIFAFLVTPIFLL
ncbi:hypothetical protein CIL03_05490 [Virgibacillus indicus]|uniref:Uncharacterized protein n=1 Tax=Virgibacillus indicus TaxID=2024554 RepID=A0A265NF21_9BACI|nr:hypothetical protein [Virgibacillus indicus]OZU90593.1 hypothetical protein CIL03_05490 [Virgibacillus indicus]